MPITSAPAFNMTDNVDVTVFTAMVSVEFVADKHGIYQSNSVRYQAQYACEVLNVIVLQAGNLERILYQPTTQQLEPLIDEQGNVPLVIPFLHLSCRVCYNKERFLCIDMTLQVISALVSLYDVHPLSCSTYYGIDSGQQCVKVQSTLHSVNFAFSERL